MSETVNKTELWSDSPIRVCFIATGADLGGAPRSLLETIEALLETGVVEPYVILRSGGALEDALHQLGVQYRVFHFPSSVKSKKIPDKMKLFLEKLYEMRLAEILQNGNFSIVHNNGVIYGAGLRAAQKAGIPSICHVREFAQYENGFVFLDESRERDTLRKCDYVIFISNAVAGRFADWVVDTNSVVLYNGFNVDRYFQQHKPLFEQEPFRMILAGHIMPTKGQMEAILATCELHKRGYSVFLTIVGHVKNPNYYQKLIDTISDEHANDFIEIRKFVENLGALRARNDISLICSTANEGLGRVTVEGMLAGCLAIGSNKGGTTEVICDGETGLLYDADNYKSLADCVERAINNRGEMRKIADEGQRRAFEVFDSKRYARILCDIYKETLLKRRDDN